MLVQLFGTFLLLLVVQIQADEESICARETFIFDRRLCEQALRAERRQAEKDALKAKRVGICVKCNSCAADWTHALSSSCVEDCKTLLKNVTDPSDGSISTISRCAELDVPSAAVTTFAPITTIEATTQSFVFSSMIPVLKPNYLFVAAAKGDAKTVDYMLRNGMNVEIRDINGWTPLTLAVQKGQKELIPLLITRGANVNGKGFKNWAPIHFAIENGDVAGLKLLLKSGAKLTAKINYESELSRTMPSQTPLIFAVRKGYFDIVKILLTAGANPTEKDVYGWTPLHFAARKENTDILKLLLSSSPNSSSSNKSPAVANNVYVNARNLIGSTPLHLASENGKLGAALVLLDNGAFVGAKNRYGWTPLHYASRNNHVHIINLLIARGANVSERANYSDDAPRIPPSVTPIMSAAKHGSFEAVQQLLQKGANPRETDSLGQNSFMLATKNGYNNIAQLLIKFVRV